MIPVVLPSDLRVSMLVAPWKLLETYFESEEWGRVSRLYWRIGHLPGVRCCSGHRGLEGYNQVLWMTVEVWGNEEEWPPVLGSK